MHIVKQSESLFIVVVFVVMAAREQTSIVTPQDKPLLYHYELFTANARRIGETTRVKVERQGGIKLGKYFIFKVFICSNHSCHCT
jgi:hypothetical protein